MIRDTIDVYLSCIDKRKVHLVFQLWLISFFTAMANVAFTASGHEPWDPPTFMVAWLAFYVALEGLATLGATFFNFWIAGRELQPMASQAADLSLYGTVVYGKDLDGFWGNPTDHEEGPHD